MKASMLHPFFLLALIMTMMVVGMHPIAAL